MNTRPMTRMIQIVNQPMRHSLTLAAMLAFGAAALPGAAMAEVPGEKLALERCASCHGKDGNTPIDPSYPRLAGQHEDYLAYAMKAYRTDRRKNAIMGAQAKLLSNEDIRDLAAYFSRLPGTMSHAR